MEFPVYIVIPMIAWVIAQGLKHVFIRYNRRKKVIDEPVPNKLMFASGGMPSAHSATVVALMFTVGLYDGYTSPVFGVAAIMAAVVMYDAIMVRYSSGKQGDALRDLIDEQKSKVVKPRVAHGHTLQEIVAGAFVGAIVAIIVFIATKTPL